MSKKDCGRLEDLADEIKVGEEPSRSEDTPPTHTSIRKKREAPAAPAPRRHSRFSTIALVGLGLAVGGAMIYNGYRYFTSEPGQGYRVVEIQQSEDSERPSPSELEAIPDARLENRTRGEAVQPYIPPQ